MDTEALMQEVFKPREVTTSASVMEYARQRQGAVIGVAALVVFLLIAGLHQFATMRNATAVTDNPAVPLSELTDITNKPDDAAPVPLPALDFQYEGRPQVMRTYIMERGAITPPEVLAEQQAAAAAAKPAPAAGTPQQPGARPPQAGQPAPAAQPVAARPGIAPAAQPAAARPGVAPAPQPVAARPGVAQPVAGARPVAAPQPVPPRPQPR
jgi:hypothetical protein